MKWIGMMIMRRIFEHKDRTNQAIVLVIAVFCFLGRIEAQTPAEPPQDQTQEDEAAIKAEVIRLIQELDSPVYKTREAALKKLQQMGTSAVPIIRASLNKLSLNTRMQLEAMLDEVVADKKNHVVQLESSMISTTDGETTVGEILRQLTAEAGFRFLDRVGIDSKATLFLEGGRKEALKVLNELCNKLGVRWAQDYNSGCYRFYRGVAGSAPVEIFDGPFRIALNSLTFNTNLQFGGEATNNCYIRGQFDMEPTADVVGVIFQPKVVTATDDQKRSVVMEDAGTANFQSSLNRRSFNFNLRINLPAKDAKKISNLHLKVPIVVPTNIETVTVQLDAKDPKSSGSSGPLEVKFVRIDKQGQKRFAVLHVIRKLPMTKTERPTEVMDQSIFLVAQDGSEEQAFGRVVRQIGKNHETLRVEIPSGEFRALTFAQITEIETRVLEFKFKDIPLP
ncbi:MAG: hypothetical protein ACI97A_002813 [Planctomycetota bacterium]|jgi:hypothetical protein